MAELPPEIEAAIADLSPEDFRALTARTRPPEDYDPAAAAKSRAAQALRQHRAVDPELAAGLSDPDPDVREATARALLSSPTGDSGEAKRAAAAAMRNHRATSPTATRRIVAGTAPSDRRNATAALQQHINVDPSTDNNV